MILSGLAIFWLAVAYLVQELSDVTVLHSLFAGFGPLISWFVLLVTLAILYSIFVCSVARIFVVDDDTERADAVCGHRHRRTPVCLSDQLARCLWLKEHSPPFYSFSQS